MLKVIDGKAYYVYKKIMCRDPLVWHEAAGLASSTSIEECSRPQAIAIRTQIGWSDTPLPRQVIVEYKTVRETDSEDSMGSFHPIAVTNKNAEKLGDALVFDPLDPRGDGAHWAIQACSALYAVPIARQDGRGIHHCPSSRRELLLMLALMEHFWACCDEADLDPADPARDGRLTIVSG